MAPSSYEYGLIELPKVVDVPDQPCQQLFGMLPSSLSYIGFDVVQYHFITDHRDGGVDVPGKAEFECLSVLVSHPRKS
jgi:hypothetical protein